MTNEEKAAAVRKLQHEEEYNSKAWLFYEGMLHVLLQKGPWNIEATKQVAALMKAR
jgi:hypothetical protein